MGDVEIASKFLVKTCVNDTHFVQYTSMLIIALTMGLSSTYRGFTTSPGTDMLSPGLVSDGTKCKDGHVSVYCCKINNL